MERESRSHPGEGWEGPGAVEGVQGLGLEPGGRQESPEACHGVSKAQRRGPFMKRRGPFLQQQAGVAGRRARRLFQEVRWSPRAPPRGRLPGGRSARAGDLAQVEALLEAGCTWCWACGWTTKRGGSGF